jgi:hypothetical protein
LHLKVTLLMVMWHIWQRYCVIRRQWRIWHYCDALVVMWHIWQWYCVIRRQWRIWHWCDAFGNVVTHLTGR